MANFNLTPRQINAIKNSAKGVLPAFLAGQALGKTVGKTMKGVTAGSLGSMVVKAMKKK